MDREKCCCFTGHRPEKLPWGRNEQSPAFHRAMAAVEAAIIARIEDGCTWFYTGMARGMDLWAAQIVLKYRDLGAGEHLGVRLCAVLPCADQAARWNREDQALHARVLAQADEKFVIFQDIVDDANIHYAVGRNSVSAVAHLVSFNEYFV